MGANWERVFHSTTGFAIAGVVALLSSAWSVGQEASDTQTYRIEGYIYRVDGAMEGIEDGADSVWQIDESATRLGQDVHIVAEDVHLQDIATLIEDQYNVRVLIDMNVVQPRAGAFDDSPEREDSNYLSDGIVPFVNLRDISLREALHALLEPMGLEFRMVRGEYIWISSPENVDDGRFNDFRMELKEKGVLFRDSGSLYLMERQPLLLGEEDIPLPRRRQLERFDSISLVANIRWEVIPPGGAVLNTRENRSLRYMEIVSRQDDLMQVRLKTATFSLGQLVLFNFRPIEQSNQGHVEVVVETRVLDASEDLPDGAVYLTKPDVSTVRREIKNKRVLMDRFFAVMVDNGNDELYLYLIKIRANKEPAPIRTVAIEGKLVEFHGTIEQELLSDAAVISAPGTIDGNAYFLPMASNFEDSIKVLGTLDREALLLSHPHVTMLVDWKRLIAFNEALNQVQIVLGGYELGTEGIFGGSLSSSHQTRLEQQLRRSVEPGGVGVIELEELRGRSVITAPINFENLSVVGYPTPVTRKGNIAASYQVDSHEDDKKFQVWIGMQCHLAERNEPQHREAQYVQTAFEADVFIGQPYALVMPMAEREYLLYAMEFRLIPIPGERRYASADVSVRALHVVGDRSRSKDRTTTLVRPREALDEDMLPGFTSIRKMELKSAPRTTTKAHWDDDSPGASTLFKVVISNAAQRGGSGGSGGIGGGRAPGENGFSGIEDMITSFAPSEYESPVKMEDVVHSVLLLDVGEEDMEYRPHTQSPARNIERITTKVGTLAQLKVEETNGEDLRVWYTYAARWNRLDGPNRIIGRETAEAQQLYATTDGAVTLGPDDVSVTILPLGHDEYAVFICEVTPIEE